MKTRIKIQGFLIFLGVVTILIFYKYIFPAPSAFSNFLATLGIGMVLLGYLLRITARGYKAQLNPEGKTLITQGPYTLTRNPMYLGTLLIGLGICISLFCWWVALIFLVIYLAIYIPQINREEATLLVRFGEAFKNYCLVTPKYFPCLLTLLCATPKDYLRLKWPWIKKELPSLLATIIFIIAAQIWKSYNIR